MSAADKIAAARALIEPLTGHTPGPWQVDAPEDESVEIAARIFAIAGLYETAPEALPDARLIAAAPALRDTVAALADLADAQAQEIERLTEALGRIVEWSEAYPLDVFQEPDFEKVRSVLEASGMTLDAVSASNMRHVLKGAGAIARAALGETP